MKQELYISNYKADLSADMATMLNFAVDDIKDFTAKQGNNSKKIVLPGTKQNDFIFNYFFDVNIRTQYSSSGPSVGTNFNAAVSVRAVLFSKNIQVFKGILKLIRVVNFGNGLHEYEVVLFGELTNLLSKLGNRKLQDLSFDPTPQTYSLSNIAGTGATDTTDFSDYVYPLIDYGTYSANKKDWNYRTFRPAIKVKSYLQKIFADANIDYDFPLINTLRFGKLIVPYNRKDFTRISNVLINNNDGQSYVVSSSSASQNNIITNSNILGNFSYSSGVLTNTGGTVTGNLFIDLIGSIDDLLNSSTTINATIEVQKNATVIYSNNFYSGTQIGSVGYFDNILLSGVSFAANDTLKVYIRFTSSVTSNYAFSFSKFQLKLIGEIDELVNINIGDTFTLNEVVPKNYLQVKFLSDIVKLFNLYIYEDVNNDNKINIKPFIDFYNENTLPALDWSYKIDRSKPISITPLGQLNARYYQFNYAKDNDYWNELYFKRYNETYGSRLFDSEFEFAKETEKIELQFASTPLVGYTGEAKVYSSIYKRNNNVEERTDSVIRILQYDVVTGAPSFDIKNDAGAVLISKTSYVYAGHLNNPDVPTNDINFGAPKELFFALVTGLLNINQFNVYWSAYMAEITDVDSKIMEANIYLNEQEIYDLDFSRKIYIDGQYWRINKILEYNANANDVCKIELINIINTSY